MPRFTMKIAGCTARVDALFDSTRDYCRNYLTEKAPDFAITVTREDLAFEQADLRREALEEGIRVRVFTDPFLERAAIQRQFAEFLLTRDTLMVHGSTVALDGQAYLFTAACGTGKSTHTRFWREVYGSRAVMVNDDKPFLKMKEDQILACGSPWSGKHGLDSNIEVPLKGICILERGKENRIRRIQPDEAAEMLYKQSYHPLDETRQPLFQALMERLLFQTAFYRMECTKDPSAALVSGAVMSGGEE